MPEVCASYGLTCFCIKKMKTFIIVFYLVCIVIMGTVSATASFINDSIFMFIVECFTNLIAVVGIVLFLNRFYSKWWIIPFVLLIVGETYLLISDVSLAYTDIIFICVVFSPALYWNYLVTRSIKNI